MEQRLLVARDRFAGTLSADPVVGQAPAFLSALREALLAAREQTPVLVVGEHGTGREVIARLIHSGGPRAGGPFIPVHCAALPAAEMDVELFGAESDGAPVATGRLEAADAGTLYLHQVTQLDRSTQARLLRVLEQGGLRRVRGSGTIPAHARLVASTDQPVETLADGHRFRPDLLARLKARVIHTPPLRERREDIPALARHYLNRFRRSAPVAAEDFSQDALDLLVRYPWPGNLRELRNVVERALVLHRQSPLIRAVHLPPEFHEAGVDALHGGRSLTQAVNAFERRLVEWALAEAGGVQTRAAELLGTTRRVLKYRMEKFNISAP